MLDQNTIHIETDLAQGIEPSGSAPLSVSAPRAAAIASHAPNRLGDVVARAEILLAHLESRLIEERSASERASRATAEMEERLRLGVRMLQAFDVQVERGEQASARAAEIVAQCDGQLQDSARNAESRINELVERLVREKFEWIDRELAWRFDRVREVEERIEQAANGKLAWLDAELGQRLGRMNDACVQAERSLERAESMVAQLSGASETLDRAERVAGTLAALTADSENKLQSLSQRSNDAAALRESLGTLVHEVAASREVVQGEMNRMRDDLSWLVATGERLTGELVERADKAKASAAALRAQTDAAAPMVEELSTWMPLISGADRESIRPVADAIVGRVRDSLAADMRGFSSAMRQFADRADHAFALVRLDPTLAPFDARQIDPKDLARSFATEVSRLGAHTRPAAAPSSLAPAAVEFEFCSVISTNRPLELGV